MARKRNENAFNQTFELYSHYVLTTDEKRKEFEELTEEKKTKKVSAWRTRNKHLFIAQQLKNISILNPAEFKQLKETLNGYIQQIEEEEKHIIDKEIKSKEKEKQNLQKELNRKIEKINKEIEVLQAKK